MRVKSSSEESLVELIFNLKIDNTDDNGALKVRDQLKSLHVVIVKFKMNEGENLPYPQITEYIYKNEEYNIESLEEQLENISLYWSNPELEDFFRKFIRHARLAVAQKKYFKEQVEKANNRLEEINKTVSQANVEFNDIRKNVYTDFISILGIFSALLFGLFVGFDTFKEIIAGITSTAKISRVVIAGSLTLMGLIALVFILLSGISMLTSRQLKTCCDDKFCRHNLYQKYPVFTISFVTLNFILIGASVLTFLNHSGLLYEHPFITTTSLLIISALLFSYVLGLMRFPDEYVRKSNKDK